MWCKAVRSSILATGWLLVEECYREGKSVARLVLTLCRQVVYCCMPLCKNTKTIGQILVITGSQAIEIMLKNCLKATRQDNCSFVYYSAILTMFIALPVP